jgi:hypothetical protein
MLSVESFVDARAALPSGAYEFPSWKTPEVFQCSGITNDDQVLGIPQLPQRGAREAGIVSDRETAMEQWRSARALWEAHVSTLSPGESFYFVVNFISAAVHYGKKTSSSDLDFLLGDGTAAGALKQWVSQHPAAASSGTVRLGQRSPCSVLFALLLHLESLMIGCVEDEGFTSGWCEVYYMARLLLEADVPFESEVDSAGGISELCHGLYDLAPAVSWAPELVECCRYFHFHTMLVQLPPAGKRRLEFVQVPKALVDMYEYHGDEEDGKEVDGEREEAEEEAEDKQEAPKKKLQK